MHEVAQLIITNNFRTESFDLRNKNVSLTIIIDVTNHASENKNNFYHISNSQLEDQKPLSNINTNFNNIVDKNNDASNDFTSLNEIRRFENLTSIQRFRFMKFEIKKLMNVKKLKLAQMKNAREHKREYNDDYYRDSNRKKANVIKMFKKQYLNYYNFIIMFL